MTTVSESRLSGLDGVRAFVDPDSVEGQSYERALQQLQDEIDSAIAELENLDSRNALILLSNLSDELLRVR